MPTDDGDGTLIRAVCGCLGKEADLNSWARVKRSSTGGVSRNVLGKELSTGTFPLARLNGQHPARQWSTR